MEQPNEKSDGKKNESDQGTSSGQDGWSFTAQYRETVFIEIQRKEITAESMSKRLNEEGYECEVTIKYDPKSGKNSGALEFVDEQTAKAFCEKRDFVQDGVVKPRCASSSSDSSVETGSTSVPSTESSDSGNMDE
ncbi:uncharacterized protein LOC129578914 isoform X3 [Sitodiplosis mosellana]|uniref:uncharacterized protein LOC129578914 isoform X2 n=1 Tax=Sitodiplosis mosellana TaxID=263140 RepID=UPI0024437A0B|nr:uncharacterized protein LOC129578914 isoform X2 [Sitodiplosis mosellana]XP_055324174.1 uncharacterized protein LOC129578914 isoform X3 [Sitodiplosis mosellana]